VVVFVVRWWIGVCCVVVAHGVGGPDRKSACIVSAASHLCGFCVHVQSHCTPIDGQVKCTFDNFLYWVWKDRKIVKSSAGQLSWGTTCGIVRSLLALVFPVVCFLVLVFSCLFCLPSVLWVSECVAAHLPAVVVVLF